MNHHVLVTGKSGSGKSEDQLRELLWYAQRGDTAIVLLDPHGNLADDLLIFLASRYQLNRVLYDRFADTDRTLGYEFITPSVLQSAFDRYAENDSNMRNTTSLIVRRGGQKDTSKNPIIELGLQNAIRLFQHQKTPVPLYWLAQLYTPNSAVFSYMVENCTDPDTKQQFEKLEYMNPQTREYQTGPADRRLRALMMLPPFALRCGGSTFDFDEFLANKGILILNGRGCNSDATSVMMSSIVWKTIASCKKHKHRVQIVMDEANNFSLVGLQEAQALAEVRKWNCGITIMVQILNFPEPEITTNVLQNTQLHRYFCQGSPESAAMAAKDIGIRIADPLKIHHYDTRIRTVDDGYDLIENKSHGQSKSSDGKVTKSDNTSHSIVRKVREVTDKIARYMSIPDQEYMLAQLLMTFDPGWRMDAGDKEPHYEPMQEHLWHHLTGILGGEIPEQALRNLKEAKLTEAIEEVKRSPAYKIPSLLSPPSPPSRPSPPSKAKKSGMK